jgi:hypothetical protein
VPTIYPDRDLGRVGTLSLCPPTILPHLIEAILIKFDFTSAPPFNASAVSQAANTEGPEMTDFWIVGGLMSGAFVSPLYFLVMRWLTKSQRAAFFVLIGALLLAISAQIYNSSIAGHYLTLAEILAMFRPLSFFALTLGWFVCGFFHALVSLGRAWAPQAMPASAHD